MMADFETFWRAFPHRPKCRNRMSALQYWGGVKPLADGSRITPDLHERIAEGAAAYRELAGDYEYRVNACRWLFNGMWEDALEELGERQAEEAVRSNSRAFREAYHAWKEREHAAGRVGTREEFEAQVASGRPVLRVVGE